MGRMTSHIYNIYIYMKWKIKKRFETTNQEQRCKALQVFFEIFETSPNLHLLNKNPWPHVPPLMRLAAVMRQKRRRSEAWLPGCCAAGPMVAVVPYFLGLRISKIGRTVIGIDLKDYI